MPDLVHLSGEGLACPRGGFTIDPWKPVPLAVITHAHADHARPGSGRYLAAAPSVPVLQHRLGADAVVDGMSYGQEVRLGDVTVSFHPAGHVLGSAQVRVDDGNEVWVVSGDYKRDPDPTCAPFEVVPCDVFVTEATFALPIYRWPGPGEAAREVLAWWDACREQGIPAVLFAYAFGKSQRLLGELATLTDRTVLTHGAVESLVALYRAQGVGMLPTAAPGPAHRPGPPWTPPPPEPSARGSAWMKRFPTGETGFASGWMQVRGTRRRYSVDRGFVVSDHADWPSLLRTVRECGARRVLATHGATEAFVRFLREGGVDAAPLVTAWEGEGGSE